VRAVCVVGLLCWHALAAPSPGGPVLTRRVAGTITHMPLEVLANGIISRASGERACLTRLGAPAWPACGPPALLALHACPVGGRANAGACADTYAFGVLCWEMWTGKRAWSGMHCTQIVIAVTIRQRRLRLPSDAPAAFAELVHQCMADRPEERPNFEVPRPRRPPLGTADYTASKNASARAGCCAARPERVCARDRRSCAACKR